MARIETIKEDTGPDKGHKVKRPLPIPVLRAMKKLGEDISRGRRRRKFTQQAVAERTGLGLNTIKKMEAGDSAVQLQALAKVLHLFGELNRLSDVLDTAKDDIGLALMDDQLPRRIRNPKKSQKSF